MFFDYITLLLEYRNKFKKNKNKLKFTEELIKDCDILITKKNKLKPTEELLKDYETLMTKKNK